MLPALTLSLNLDAAPPRALAAGATPFADPPSLAFYLRTTARFEILFWSAFTRSALPDGAVVYLSAKAAPASNDGSAPLAYAAFTPPAEALGPWTADLNLNTTELLAAFGTAATLPLDFELSLFVGGLKHVAAVFTAPLHAGQLTGAEGTPAAAIPTVSLRARAALTGGAADALDAIATVSGAYDRLTIEVTTGTLAGGDLATSRWLLVPGTTAEDGVSIVRPDDYHPSTNARVWVRVG